MENSKAAPRQVDHRGLPIDSLVEDEQRLKTQVTGGLKVIALIGLIAPIPIAFLVTATIMLTGDPGKVDHSWLTKMMVLALGVYWMGAWLLLLLIKTLMRRVRVLSILSISLASIVCAASALAAAYVLFHSVDIKTGEAALGMLLVAFLFGGVVGIIFVCITAFVLSRRYPSSRQSDSASQKANVSTLVFVLGVVAIPAGFYVWRLLATPSSVVT